MINIIDVNSIFGMIGILVFSGIIGSLIILIGGNFR